MIEDTLIKSKKPLSNKLVLNRDFTVSEFISEQYFNN